MGTMDVEIEPLIAHVHDFILAHGIDYHAGRPAPRSVSDLEFLSVQHFRDPVSDGTRDPDDLVWEFLVRHLASGRLFRQRIEWDGGCGRSSWPSEIRLGERAVDIAAPRIAVA